MKFPIAILAVMGIFLTIVATLTGLSIYKNAKTDQNTNIDILPQISTLVTHPNFQRFSLPIINEVEPKLFPTVEGNYPRINNSKILIGLASPGEEKIPYLALFDSNGIPLKTFELPNKQGGSIGDRRILENGNILFNINFDGVYEITQEGLLVWHLFDPDVTHHVDILPNRNLLLAGADCNCIKEINRDTKQVVWYWDAEESFPIYDSQSYINYTSGDNIFRTRILQSEIFPNNWTHLNYAQYLPKTDTFIVSLRNFNTIVEINRAGDVIWSFGPGVLKFQHYPHVANDGTITIYDNGNGRTIRINKSHEILFEYSDLHSPFLGDNMYLSDDNYKIVESVGNKDKGIKSELRIVNPQGRVIWKMIFGYDQIYRVGVSNLN